MGERSSPRSAVHQLDAARLFRLGLERGAEGGPFHAVVVECVPFIKITEVIGRRLKVPVVSQTAQVPEHFGWFAITTIHCSTSNETTHSRLLWQPRLLADRNPPAHFAR